MQERESSFVLNKALCCVCMFVRLTGLLISRFNHDNIADFLNLSTSLFQPCKESVCCAVVVFSPDE